jgi:ATP phosphoribosyltransferase
VSLTVALSKGRLLRGTEELFARAGLPVPDSASRRLVHQQDGLRFLFVKDQDVPTYVEHGVADLGIAGRDVLLESRSELYEPLDLGFGACRLVVARPADKPWGAPRRVASKYARVAAAHFQQKGLSVEVVPLAGSVELAAVLGLADCIVDVVESGRTLAENGLVVQEEVARASARLVVNRAAFHARRLEIQGLVAQLAAAVAQEREAVR